MRVTSGRCYTARDISIKVHEICDWTMRIYVHSSEFFSGKDARINLRVNINIKIYFCLLLLSFDFSRILKRCSSNRYDRVTMSKFGQIIDRFMIFFCLFCLHIVLAMDVIVNKFFRWKIAIVIHFSFLLSLQLFVCTFKWQRSTDAWIWSIIHFNYELFSISSVLFLFLVYFGLYLRFYFS